MEPTETKPASHNRPILIAIGLTTVIIGTIAWAFVEIRLTNMQKAYDNALSENSKLFQRPVSDYQTYNYPIKEAGEAVARVDLSTPITWSDTKQGLEFELVSVEIGPYEVTAINTATTSIKNPYYKIGEKVQAAVVTMNLTTSKGGCPNITQRLATVTNGRESAVAPFNRQYSFPTSNGGCSSLAGVRYTDFRLAFPLAEGTSQMWFDPGIDDELYKTRISLSLNGSGAIQATKQVTSNLK